CFYLCRRSLYDALPISLKKTLLWAATAAALALLASPAIAADDAVSFGTWGVDTAGMDTTVDPGTDFFGYVSGTWAANTRIPSDRDRKSTRLNSSHVKIS